MAELGKNEHGKKGFTEEKTFSVPFSLGEITEKITFPPNTTSKPSI